MQHQRFRDGRLTTGFIAEEYPEGFQGAPTGDGLTTKLSAIAAIIGRAETERCNLIDGQLNGPQSAPTDLIVTLDGAEHHVSIEGDAVLVDGTAIVADVPYVPGQKLVEAIIDGDPLAVRVTKTRTGWKFTTRGATHTLRVLAPRIAALSKHMIEKIPPDLSRFLLCPMPGLITRIDVASGDKVEAGQPLAVVEAMKMENILRAEKASVIKTIEAKPGDSLAVDAVIMEFE
jgi:propionyl-CoA carboxylase alpha chain